MPENEHNGEGFHYVVGYKKHGTYDVEETQTVLDPRQKSISIHEQKESFVLFEVYVRAANKIGKAPSIEKKLVRSGEGSMLHCYYYVCLQVALFVSSWIDLGN